MGTNVDTLGVEENLDVNKGQNRFANVDIDPSKQPHQQHLSQKQERKHHHRQQDADAKQESAGQDTSSEGQGAGRWPEARSLGHCHQLAEQLAHDYNKTVVLWPCPRMKVSTSLLIGPSQTKDIHIESPNKGRVSSKDQISDILMRDRLCVFIKEWHKGKTLSSWGYFV